MVLNTALDIICEGVQSSFFKPELTSGSVTSRHEASEADVQTWLSNIQTRRGDDGRFVLNEKQYEMVSLVVNQVCKEIRASNTGNYSDWSPFRWSMHGGPGTGKSHVIKIIKSELFEQVLKWKIVENFQIVALQAVMADLLGGDTIHHALNLPVYGRARTL